MIPLRLRLFAILAVILLFQLFIYLLKKNRIELRYAMLWFFSGVMMVLLSLFPQLLNRFANLLGIIVPANALFAAAFFVLLLLSIAFTSIISREKQEIVRLVQEVAILENRIRQLESEISTDARNDCEDL